MAEDLKRQKNSINLRNNEVRYVRNLIFQTSQKFKKVKFKSCKTWWNQNDVNLWDKRSMVLSESLLFVACEHCSLTRYSDKDVG